MADQRRDRETVTRVINGWLRERGQRQRAKTFSQRHPARHRTRHGHRVPADFRYGGFSGKQIRMPAGWRTTGRIQTVKFFTVPDNGKSIAADAVAGRLDNGQRHGGRNRRINGISAQL